MLLYLLINSMLLSYWTNYQLKLKFFLIMKSSYFEMQNSSTTSVNFETCFGINFIFSSWCIITLLLLLERLFLKKSSSLDFLKSLDSLVSVARLIFLVWVLDKEVTGSLLIKDFSFECFGLGKKFLLLLVLSSDRRVEKVSFVLAESELHCRGSFGLLIFFSLIM